MSNTLNQILKIEIKDVGSKVFKLIDINEANDALYQLILTEVIGEDDHPRVEGHDLAVIFLTNDMLRAEQRQTLAKLFNKEKE